MSLRQSTTLALLLLAVAGAREFARNHTAAPDVSSTWEAGSNLLLAGLGPGWLRKPPIAQVAGAGSAVECTYYVSPSGSDSNNGSLSAPWRTLQRAFSGVGAGQIVCLMGGTYPIPSTLQSEGYSQILSNSGTSSGWITFTNYPGQVAIINGATRIQASYARFVGTPLNAPGLIFSGPMHQNLGLIDVMYSHDITFDHVEIRNADYHAGIYLFKVSNIKLLGCYIHDNGRFNETLTAQGNLSSSVDQGVYFDSTSGGGNVIANCVVYHNRAMGIQLYPSPAGVVVEENTIVDNDSYGMVIYGHRNVIVNNIFSNNGWYTNNPQFKVYEGTDHTIDSNILWSVNPLQRGYSESTHQPVTGSIIKDPCLAAVPTPPGSRMERGIAFWDLGSLNFRVLTGSPASGVSNISCMQPLDRLGLKRTSQPDLGAYEHNR